MAIEVIPKQKIKRVPRERITLYVIVGVFIAFLLSYFILIFFQNKASQDLAELEKNLARTEQENQLEKQLLSTKKLVDDWNLLANEHRLPLAVFELLQKNTLPSVWFSEFKFNLGENLLLLEGQTQNYESLGQQVLIFQEHKLIHNVQLSKVSVGREGEIIFDLQLVFDPIILK